MRTRFEFRSMFRGLEKWPACCFWLCMVSSIVVAIVLQATCAAAEDSIPFTVKVLTVDANEGCDIADFDGDGKLDVVAGRNWYHNPDWLPRPVRLIEDVNGYVHSNGDFAYDVNGDGKPDVVAGDFFNTQVYWYENKGADDILKGFLWPKHELVDTGLGANEIAFFHDLDGDGQPEWICNSWIDKNPLVAWKFAKGVDVEQKKDAKGNATNVTTVTIQGVRHLISEVGQSHGFGFGDINNDGREDILTAAGWFEKPEGDVWENPWKYHSDWKTRWSCPVIVKDLNADGKNDIIIGSPHDYGLMVWWAEEPSADGKLNFREETIDKSYSQLHCLHMADLDGDGRAELITGKRVRAHNANDPGAADPPIICYYSIDPAGKFTKHVINEGQVGIGLQIRTADIDGDGDLDIVVPGKEGTQILFNGRK